MKLRCPGYPQLTFNGNSATLSPETDADGTSHVYSGNAGPDSWAWGEALTREIAKLRREPTIGRWRGSSGAGGGASSRRLLDAVSEAAGGEASVFVSVSSAVRVFQVVVALFLSLSVVIFNQSECSFLLICFWLITRLRAPFFFSLSLSW